MSRAFEIEEGFIQYLLQHKDHFEEKLLSEAINVSEKIEEILLIGNIDLLNNAHKLVLFVVNQKDEELIKFAKQEGIAWATHSLTLAFKLEWVQAIRRTIWYYIQKYYETENPSLDQENFFILEKTINNHVDQFLNTFFISYSECKDQLIEEQRSLVENLSVPIIPITPSICILPLIGELDPHRAQIVEEKVLIEINKFHIQQLIIDLSGIAEMEAEVVDYLIKLIDGANMMGCDTIITGLRPEIVREMINLGVSFENRAKTTGSLQQAIKNFIVI